MEIVVVNFDSFKHTYHILMFTVDHFTFDIDNNKQTNKNETFEI